MDSGVSGITFEYNSISDKISIKSFWIRAGWGWSGQGFCGNTRVNFNSQSAGWWFIPSFCAINLSLILIECGLLHLAHINSQFHWFRADKCGLTRVKQKKSIDFADSFGFAKMLAVAVRSRVKVMQRIHSIVHFFSYISNIHINEGILAVAEPTIWSLWPNVCAVHNK